MGVAQPASIAHLVRPVLWLVRDQSSWQPLLGVFRIRFLIGARCCRSRVKCLSLIPVSKNQMATTKKCPWLL